MKRTAILAAAAALLAGVALGAAPAPKKKPASSTPAAPTPGPEVKKLADFVGTWKIEGEMQKSPMGPGGRTSATSVCSWFDGEFFLVCHDDGTSPMGKSKGLEILGWDAGKKHYTFWSIDSFGMSEISLGTVAGDTWTFMNDEKMGNETVKSRFMLVRESPDRTRLSWSISPDGNTWSELFKGEETRVKEARKTGKR